MIDRKTSFSPVLETLQMIALLAVTGSAAAAALEGRVIAVADGDTITLLDQQRTSHRIRLQGIDAPEKRQSFGARSGQHLSRLVFGKHVVADCDKRDRYGRNVCKVQANGVDINLRQVEAGLAWWYRDYAREQSMEDRRDYEAAENGARGERRGLWADPAPVPPWTWRRSRKAGTL